MLGQSSVENIEIPKIKIVPQKSHKRPFGCALIYLDKERVRVSRWNSLSSRLLLHTRKIHFPFIENFEDAHAVSRRRAVVVVVVLDDHSFAISSDICLCVCWWTQGEESESYLGVAKWGGFAGGVVWAWPYNSQRWPAFMQCCWRLVLRVVNIMVVLSFFLSFCLAWPPPPSWVFIN